MRVVAEPAAAAVVPDDVFVEKPPDRVHVSRVEGLIAATKKGRVGVFCCDLCHRFRLRLTATDQGRSPWHVRSCFVNRCARSGASLAASPAALPATKSRLRYNAPVA